MRNFVRSRLILVCTLVVILAAVVTPLTINHIFRQSAHAAGAPLIITHNRLQPLHATTVNSKNKFNVNLSISNISGTAITNYAFGGVIVDVVVQNGTPYIISYRSGCVGPLLRLTTVSKKILKPTYYAGASQTNFNRCVPTTVNIPANSTSKLTATYILQDSTTLSPIPNGAYQASEEISFTVVTTNASQRYKKLSDGSIVDTYPATHVSSGSQLLQINSNAVIPDVGANILQSTSGNSAYANAKKKLPKSVNANNLLVASISCASNTLNTPKDSLGNYWYLAARQSSGPNNAYEQGIYYTTSAKNGYDTVTFACKSKSSFTLAAFSGLTAYPLDQTGNASGYSASASVVTSAATTQLYDMVVGMVGDNSTTAHTYTSTIIGYNNVQHNYSKNGNINFVYGVTGTTGYYQTAWNSSATTYWGALQVAFKIAPTPPAYPYDSYVGSFTPKVLVIDYNTSGLSDDGSSALTQELLNAYTTGSQFHGSSFSSANLQIYNTYEEYNPPPILPGTTHGNFDGDYQAVFSKYNICNLAQTQGVNFVWIWASGSEQGGINYSADFHEWVTTGPTFYQTYGATVPTCGSTTVSTFGFNYSRNVAEAVHSSGHYMENVLQFAFGPADFSGPGGTDMYDLFDGQVSRYNGYTGPLNTQTASCGDVHFPPNATQAYDYGDTTVVNSDCATYNPGDPSSQNYVPVSINTWQSIPCDPSQPYGSFDCNQESYLLWWMQNMPGYGNGILDNTDNPMPNWWQYILALDTTVRYN